MWSLTIVPSLSIIPRVSIAQNLTIVQSLLIVPRTSTGLHKCHPQDSIIRKLDDFYIFSIHHLLRTVNGVVSSLFLILTLGVYVALDNLNNLNGLIVRNNIVSMTCMTFYLVIAFKFTHTFSYFVCKMVGFVGYFFTMAQFAWMAVLSFDIFWTFSKVRMPERKMKKKRYLLYSLLGWGWALLLTLTLVLADIFIDNKLVSIALRGTHYKH